MGRRMQDLKILARRLWVLYRLTPAEQKQIEAFQGEHSGFRLLLGKRLGTDHDHRTGLIRGRLEWRLNRALGMIEKAAPTRTAAVLRALAEYLDNPPATTALGKETFGLIGLAKYKKKMVYGPPEGS
jgi:hypothetical protein